MQNVSVTSLVINFADACRALVPMLDGAAAPWGEEGQDDWRRIAESLFHALVTKPCASAAVGAASISQLRIAAYDSTPAPDDCNAYVAVEAAKPQRMLRLTTKDRPFDMVTVFDGKTEKRMRLTECRFIFVYQVPHGTEQRLREVDLDAE